jgi:predicted transcriptional regulator
MVLGYLLATGIETAVELSFWIVRKTTSGIYYYVYPEEEKVEMSKKDLEDLKEEISELKELVKIKQE